MNVTTMITKIWTRMNLSASNDFFTSDDITNLINDGYRDFTQRTQCLKKFVLMDITSGTTEYSLPSDCLEILWIGYDNEGIEPVALKDLDKHDENWIGRSGEPFCFIQELDGFTKIRLYQTPGVSSTALSDDTTAQTDFDDWDDNLLLFEIYEPSALSASSSPDLEVPFQWAPIYYALWKAFEGEGDYQDLEQAGFYMRRYFELVEEKKSLIADNLTVIAGSGQRRDDLEDKEDGPYINPENELEYDLQDVLVLEIASDGRLSFGDDGTDGTWKLARSSNDLLYSRRESGSYVEKGRDEA